MKFIRKNYLKIGLILAIIAGIGWFVRSKFQPDPQTVYQPGIDQLITPKRQEIIDQTILAGSIDSDSIATLRFQSSGQLTWVGVKVGDRIKKWQSLASIDKKVLEKQLQADLNNYLTNRSTFEDTQDQYKPIKEKVLLTDELKRILDRTQYSLNNSVINYEISSLALRYSTLTSPINGIVTAIDQSNPGVNISPATYSITVIDPNSLYFKSEIDQDTVPRLTLGQTAIINLDSFSDQPIDSEISYISFTPIAGQTSTVYQLRFKLPLENDNLTYRLGMDGDATIVLSKSSDALTVDTDAINDDGNGNKFVYLKNDANQLVQTTVKTGIETDTLTEILEGVSQNDQIVIKKRSF